VDPEAAAAASGLDAAAFAAAVTELELLGALRRVEGALLERSVPSPEPGPSGH
jgi:hypothetical protein